jgi:hypothetical protein
LGNLSIVYISLLFANSAARTRVIAPLPLALPLRLFPVPSSKVDKHASPLFIAILPGNPAEPSADRSGQLQF